MSKFIPSTLADHQSSHYGRTTRAAAMHYYPRGLYGTGYRRSAQCLPHQHAGVRDQTEYGGDYGASMGWAWKLDSIHDAVPGGKEIYQTARDQLVIAKAGAPLKASELPAANLTLQYKLSHQPVDVLAAKLLGSISFALASRIRKDPAVKADLLQRAEDYYDEGSCNMCVVWDDPDDIVAINKSIIASLTAANGTGDESLNWLIAVRGGGTDVTAVEAAQRYSEEASLVGIVKGTASATAEEVGELAVAASERVKAGVTGTCPESWGAFECWWKTTGTRWAMGIGVVAVGAGVLMWLGRPYLQAAQRVLPKGEK